ncbi:MULTISPECIES: phospholipase C [Subtercola]|uniref:Phospholipase n=1 Tax=Subtercola vilae TaxID=2056433 RepID=A0A4T2C0Q8_9MICO|nr:MULTISPECIES: alkaline phosphatase family protein [Subtercola]MEA9987169.1 alkaline phosphatase family protein [Subtercola sp. RTI3]TIH36631.1 phospholipase [Subtercola vilae]
MFRLTQNRAVRVAVPTLALAGMLGAALLASPAVANTGDASSDTTTPIKHVVVIFDENISFDHYFGTYPKAANTDGTSFTAAAGTPTPNNLVSSNTLTGNPNLYDPSRLSPAQAITCDQNHGYSAEQAAENNGAMNMFVQKTSTDTCTGQTTSPGLAMDYYDGNTTTALWNYAQNYSMSDNYWDTTFGPSTPGALNLVSGQTHGAVAKNSVTGATLTSSTAVISPDANGVGTVIGDPDPAYDDCSDNNHTSTSATVAMQGTNIGDLLNTKNVTWGWFQGGFAPTTAWSGTSGTYATCSATTTNVGGTAVRDYSPHHSPFEYYASTSNPHHLAPTSDAMIGHTDQANHNYDLSNFSTALSQNNLPAVSFLKAPEAQDGHASYSDPIDEQKFLVNQINAIQSSPEWSSTAIVVTYDDSDGWYDHVAPTILNGSTDSSTDKATCTTSTAPVAGGYQDRCGPSQRLPLVVISPYSKQNAIDSTATEQTSVTKFIEDNWSTGRIGDSSFDDRAGKLTGLFDFANPQQRAVLLAADGSVSSIVPVAVGSQPTSTATPSSSAPPASAAPTSAATTTASGPNSGALANTGLEVTGWVSLMVVLIGAGVTLLMVRRRRHSAGGTDRPRSGDTPK